MSSYSKYLQRTNPKLYVRNPSACLHKVTLCVQQTADSGREFFEGLQLQELTRCIYHLTAPTQSFLVALLCSFHLRLPAAADSPPR